MNQPRFWSLPSSFIGYQGDAYGGVLHCTFSFIGEGYPGQSSGDFVIACGGRRFYFYLHNPPSSEEKRSVALPMFEEAWKDVDGRSPTRHDFLKCLSNVTSILVRMAYSSQPTVSRLSSFSLSGISSADSDLGTADAVEHCVCPPEYSGLSCEGCAQGFKMTYRGGCIKECPTENPDLVLQPWYRASTKVHIRCSDVLHTESSSSSLQLAFSSNVSFVNLSQSYQTATRMVSEVWIESSPEMNRMSIACRSNLSGCPLRESFGFFNVYYIHALGSLNVNLSFATKTVVEVNCMDYVTSNPVAEFTWSVERIPHSKKGPVVIFFITNSGFDAVDEEMTCKATNRILDLSLYVNFSLHWHPVNDLAGGFATKDYSASFTSPYRGENTGCGMLCQWFIGGSTAFLLTLMSCATVVAYQHRKFSAEVTNRRRKLGKRASILKVRGITAAGGGSDQCRENNEDGPMSSTLNEAASGSNNFMSRAHSLSTASSFWMPAGRGSATTYASPPRKKTVYTRPSCMTKSRAFRSSYSASSIGRRRFTVKPIAAASTPKKTYRKAGSHVRSVKKKTKKVNARSKQSATSSLSQRVRSPRNFNDGVRRVESSRRRASAEREQPLGLTSLQKQPPPTPDDRTARASATRKNLSTESCQ